MLLKTENMRFINKRWILTLATVLCFAYTQAQEIIKEPEKAKPTKDSLKPRKLKIDGIIATVGDYNILESDIDKSFLELTSQGNSIKDITRCQMLGKLLEDRLYAH